MGIWQAMRRSADRDPSPIPHLIMGWLGAAALIAAAKARLAGKAEMALVSAAVKQALTK